MGRLVRSGSKYTDEDRRIAAANYAILGSNRAVGREMNIPTTTIDGWAKTEWWAELVNQAREHEEDRFRARCHQIVDKATESILDRLENGDEVHTKDGIIKLKVKAGDLAKIGGIYYDKLRLSLNMPTRISDSSGTKQAIKQLAQQFAEISREQYEEKQANVVVTDPAPVE